MSIGLKDKKGREIHEGDIMQLEEDPSMQLVVKYIAPCFWLTQDGEGLFNNPAYFKERVIVGRIVEVKSE